MQTAANIEQRYPFAGAANPSVELWQYNVDWRATENLADSTDHAYLASQCIQRWRPYQCQDRLQQTLTILRKGYTQQAWSSIFVDSSTTWVN